jgi:hypothetical protein
VHRDTTRFCDIVTISPSINTCCDQVWKCSPVSADCLKYWTRVGVSRPAQPSPAKLPLPGRLTYPSIDPHAKDPLTCRPPSPAAVTSTSSTLFAPVRSKRLRSRGSGFLVHLRDKTKNKKNKENSRDADADAEFSQLLAVPGRVFVPPSHVVILTQFGVGPSAARVEFCKQDHRRQPPPNAPRTLS